MLRHRNAPSRTLFAALAAAALGILAGCGIKGPLQPPPARPAAAADAQKPATTPAATPSAGSAQDATTAPDATRKP